MPVLELGSWHSHTPPSHYLCASSPLCPSTLVRYGFQPHRVALWIYWHAVLLLLKGVPLYRCASNGLPHRACVCVLTKRYTHDIWYKRTIIFVHLCI